VLAAIAIFELYATGNRIFLFQAAILMASALVLMRRHRELGLLIVLSAPLGVAMTAFRFIRTFLHSSSSLTEAVQTGLALASLYRGRQRGFATLIQGVTESVNINVAVGLIETIPRDADFLGGATFVKVLLAPIPRSILPNKPYGASTVAAEFFAPPEAVTSFNTLLFGEGWMNFGSLALLVLPLLIVLLDFMCRYFFGSKNRLLGGLLGLVIGVTVVRMAFSDVALQLLLAIGFIWLFSVRLTPAMRSLR